MNPVKRTPARNFSLKLSSVRTGIILLILVGISSASGTLILQRPTTDPEEIQRAYSPQVLRWLDLLGLTDVFHSWWFVVLLSLLGVTIVLASLERFPTVWHYFARPYRRPDSHFISALPTHQEIRVPDAETGLAAAERTFRQLRFRPRRVEKNGEFSLFVEKNRFARLAAYVVHASLLIIFAGGITDSLRGYRGFVGLVPGQVVNQVELRNGRTKPLPFSVRCDATGQENYADGSPRRWWSKLAVLEEGREVERKEIAVNEPLVYHGIRFYQSSYGSTGQFDSVTLTAALKTDPAKSKESVLHPNQSVKLDPATSVQVITFVPDFVLNGNEIENRSNELNNPALQLLVTSRNSKMAKVWVFPRFPEMAQPDESPYTFQLKDVAMGHYTGLQVSYEPGQWAVWAGCILLALGLAAAFYFIHMRFWVVPVSDGRGRMVLWIGASASKNRQEFEQRFQRVVEQIQNNVTESRPVPAARGAFG